ncbi:TolC family protein [uncultured Cytophaga sp.]|mgnify:CR=1 FL=1|uniref:TolC family protein n=1 Tax=uncultured Cytophaga sp. TaxID=160238 RepID=UPI0026301C86|nr:TolC family protein [uncultured Cytophaga sp.]
MLKNKRTGLVLFILVSISTQAQVLTYDSIKTAIIQSNPMLEMYANQAKSYDAMAIGARAWDAPEIGFGLFMTPYQTSYWKPQMQNVDGTNTMMPGMGNLMIEGKQMIPNPSRLRANQTYMQAMSSVELETQRAEANKLLADAKMNYYDIQIIDKKLQVLTEAEKTLQVMITMGEKNIAYNQGSLASIYKAKSQQALLKKDRSMWDNERNQKVYMINTLMNRDKYIAFIVDTTIKIQQYEKQIVDTSNFISKRSDLLAIDKNIRVTQLKQRAESFKAKPDFGIQYGHMFTFGDNPNMFTLMGMVTVPIAPWSSKMYKSNVMAANYQIKAMQNEKAAIINESTGRLYGIQNQIKSTKYQLELYETILMPAIKKTYDVSMIAYAQNTGELFETLDARMNLQMTQLQYYDILLELLTLQAEYEKQLQIY